ncbi:EamA/RhaT family transporter, type 5 [Campylobacter blaseri]|uniref:EamA family transporter n=1 Tax=Campylobacter blaseri TaxID=2042961 RepID=A0A2P8R3D6_9BACT|nr:DMT family transporter [Campylobacter blaseri]PSM52999.1 EamA family transporter [Campylobacter blaseri]PSM54466.1 EamA family transporter [Campylobacter blaseri]QKF85290.1 EamA/RhaT family transporter, type 5 [Campylobacter blaseri]
MSKSLMSEIALIFVAISWGATFLPVQSAIESINVFSFLFFRFLVSTILMYLISLKFGIKFTKNSILYGALLGLFLFGGFSFQTYALKYTLSSTVAFITGLYVILVPFIMFVFFKQHVKLTTIFGGIVALVGLYFLSGANSFDLNLGELLTIICAVSYALHISFTGVYVHKSNIYALVTTQFGTTALLSLIFAIFFSNNNLNTMAILGGFEIWLNIELLYAIILTAVIATVFAFFVQTLAQQYTTAAKTVLIFTLEPVSAGVIGYLWANEILSKPQIFGAILILLGILICEVAPLLIKRKN